MKTQVFGNSGCINQCPEKLTKFHKLNFKPCKRNLKKLLKSYLIANVIPLKNDSEMAQICSKFESKNLSHQSKVYLLKLSNKIKLAVAGIIQLQGNKDEI